MTVDVVSVVVGPEQHGVTRHALALAGATGVGVERHLDATAATEGRVPPSARRAPQVVHWHFTDRLFGDDVTTAARRFLSMAESRSARHVVSLHDVPTGRRTRRQVRRADAYRAVASVADVVVVASEHERRRLRRSGIDADAVVIPLPVPTAGPMTVPDPVAPSPPTVGVLGFVYPGKGHEEVLAACTRLPADVEVIALGGVSPGHETLVEDLTRAAKRAGRRFRVTGFLHDVELTDAARSVSVPVVAARAPSASASIGTWVAAGRRPVAVRNGFVDELDRRAPGLLAPCRADELAAAVERALRDPASTWRDRPVPDELSEGAVAAAHRDLYRRVAR